ncbi:MATE family efflux transporter [Empedobacter sp. GD03739]|uniref:lipopolysaccharide biosynthesis protein n=1 Tax=Empedobacter sp. GD03739 TaxID=2975376 RepID=UPI002446F058|nr:MATE family efflux transporter [Empedobacter sp. GD03739]MDH1601212.1 MATE family efflux transporter [Empedobacter sp. GD03739]
MAELNSNKKILKNSLSLYVRMGFTLLVALYTSRVLLNRLGVDDYGLYTIVGGLISFLGFLNMAMSSTTQRFLAFEIGRGNKIDLNNTFNLSILIHLILGIVILIIGETLGNWYVLKVLNIQESQRTLAFIIFQLTLCMFFIKVIQVPFSALITSHEKMNIFARISIADALLNLGLLLVLNFIDNNKLIFYTSILLGINFIIFITNFLYCKFNFKEIRLKFYYDQGKFKDILSYSSWSLVGNLAAVSRGYGINIILNLFFGVVINAAYGVTMQFQSAVSMFTDSFRMAINPQIIKNYANENMERMYDLIYLSSKFSYFIMLFIVIPAWINIDFILKLWLVNPPEYTSIFVRLSVVYLLIESVSGALITAVQATGKIKVYQIVTGFIILLNLPVSYLFLKLGYDPYITYIISIILSVLALCSRLYFLRKLIQFPLKEYFSNVFQRILITIPIITVFIYLIKDCNQSLIQVMINILLSTFLSAILILLFGISRNEKGVIKSIILKKIKK